MKLQPTRREPPPSSDPASQPQTSTAAPLTSPPSAPPSSGAGAEHSLVPKRGQARPFAAQSNWLVFGPSPIHGTGGFAQRAVPAGTRIVEYLGERIDRHESLRRCEADNQYIFALNEREDIDGNVDWNPARFINHSCAPNSEALVEDDRVWLVASRDIAPREEITFNYGFDLESYRQYPCKCGAANCAGFIVAEEFFDHVRRMTALRAVGHPKNP